MKVRKYFLYNVIGFWIYKCIEILTNYIYICIYGLRLIYIGLHYKFIIIIWIIICVCIKKL
jgi:hypothetical protein